MIVIAGGCGFIGSNFVLDWLSHNDEPIIVIDNLTYAGNIHNLDAVKGNSLFQFIKGDIDDRELLLSVVKQYQPRAIINFAAETHVDRSIKKPDHFIKTNINGTFTLLEVAKNYWLNLKNKDQFRFIQISTDEVYGSLNSFDAAFTEKSAYSPNNPYSASKAAADHLVLAYYHTYGLPTIISNCSNNYGPYQFPEKLIPLTILNIQQNKPLFIYGDGLQIRDWLFVIDHCVAIRKIVSDGTPGETYNIGGCNEKTNLEVVHIICHLLDSLKPSKKSYSSLITHIIDRPGHDRRYAIDASKIEHQLGWKPMESFESGLRKTILWYLNNPDWIHSIAKRKNYQQWLETNYEKREHA